MTQSPQKKPPSPPPRPPAPPPRAATSADGATQQMPARTMPMNPQAAKAAKAKAAPPPGAAPKAAKRSAAKAGPSPGNPTLQEIVKRADEDGVSDIHVGVNEIPRFRKRGDITSLEYPRTDLNTFMSWLRECMTDEEIRQFQDHLDFDGAFDFGFVRIRINVFDSLAGPAMVLRLIPSNILTMEQLKSPEVFKDICHYHKGLILVTGPTGSGKSTTMAAMIDYINRNMAHHIITIEDPVEFVHVSQKSLVKHREVGRHTREFKNALKAALREDPDLMLVGEIRDKETMGIALKAASTGHLVMGTLHTNSAVKTIERIMGMFPPAEQPALRVSLAESLVCIVAQGLCKTTDGKRAAFHDIMIATDAVKEYVIKNDLEAITQIMLRSEFEGMTTMNKALYNLYQEGRITEETALEKSPTPNEMAQFLRGRI
ncbi:MAG: type IV pilus twitching motility protein PilT [Roseofilum sp. SBFL]|uniref:type IV pilus twitching motility protein PilT n=2 Tax=unclassified Roseofilum TaxID=2620099 RepID=UPI001B0F2E10|nr:MULTISPECIES: type IV pilus twitching motility protein PilT [unclassified Roseofilum]MBP0012735.1 type IV pilus twitching motility protein PilT [Roseofilum sp. SID3]MBP0043523.1 type IV pilus twitching motility protein PilT [Roseofilum sp. SBFL]